MTAAGLSSLTPLAWLALGATLAALYILIGRRLDGRAEPMWWASGLVVAASIYVGFALARGAPPVATAFEVGGVVAYGGLAGLGLRDRRWLAAGWLLHPVWDGLHRPGGFALAPEWYVWACLSFDVVVGLWLVANVTRPRA